MWYSHWLESSAHLSPFSPKQPVGQAECCPWEIVVVLSNSTCLELELFPGGRDPSMLSFEAKSLTENDEAITQITP